MPWAPWRHGTAGIRSMRRRRPRRRPPGGAGRGISARVGGAPARRPGHGRDRPEVARPPRRTDLDPDVDRPGPRWNLLDPLIGFVVAQVLSALVAAVVVQAQAAPGAGVGIGLAETFDG